MRLSGRQNSIVLNLSLGSHHRVVLAIQDHSLSLHCLHTNITVRKLSLSNS